MLLNASLATWLDTFDPLNDLYYGEMTCFAVLGHDFEHP